MLSLGNESVSLEGSLTLQGIEALGSHILSGLQLLHGKIEFTGGQEDGESLSHVSKARNSNTAACRCRGIPEKAGLGASEYGQDLLPQGVQASATLDCT